MTQKLLSRVRDIMGECDLLDHPLERTLSVDGGSFILKNPLNGKSILIGEANLAKGTKSKYILAFTINSSKWKWAEDEGFTRDDIIDIFANDIFEQIDVNETPSYLIA